MLPLRTTWFAISWSCRRTIYSTKVVWRKRKAYLDCGRAETLLGKLCLVVATTGIAAFHVIGFTLHSAREDVAEYNMSCLTRLGRHASGSYKRFAFSTHVWSKAWRRREFGSDTVLVSGLSQLLWCCDAEYLFSQNGICNGTPGIVVDSLMD